MKSPLLGSVDPTIPILVTGLFDPFASGHRNVDLLFCLQESFFVYTCILCIALTVRSIGSRTFTLGPVNEKHFQVKILEQIETMTYVRK